MIVDKFCNNYYFKLMTDPYLLFFFFFLVYYTVYVMYKAEFYA